MVFPLPLTKERLILFTLKKGGAMGKEVLEFAVTCTGNTIDF